MKFGKGGVVSEISRQNIRAVRAVMRSHAYFKEIPWVDSNEELSSGHSDKYLRDSSGKLMYVYERLITVYYYARPTKGRGYDWWFSWKNNDLFQVVYGVTSTGELHEWAS